MADRTLEMVVNRATKDGTPFRVDVLVRTGTVLAVAYLDGKEIGAGGTVGYPLPKAYGDLTHAAGYPPARVIGLTAVEAQAIKSACDKHHHALYAAEDAQHALDAKLGALLADFDAARAQQDFARARRVEAEIAATRKGSGLPLDGWRE